MFSDLQMLILFIQTYILIGIKRTPQQNKKIKQYRTHMIKSREKAKEKLDLCENYSFKLKEGENA